MTATILHQRDFENLHKRRQEKSEVKEQKNKLRLANRFVFGDDPANILPKIISKKASLEMQMSVYYYGYIQDLALREQSKIIREVKEEQLSGNKSHKNPAKQKQKRITYIVNGEQRSMKVETRTPLSEVFDQCKKCQKIQGLYCPTHRKIVERSIGKLYAESLRKEKLTKLQQRRIRKAVGLAYRQYERNHDLEIDFYEFTKEEILEVRKNMVVPHRTKNGVVKVGTFTVSDVSVLPQLDNYEYKE